MIKVGLTGGLSAGKTTVAKLFISLGVPVFFSDKVARKLQENNEELIEILKQNFGYDIYNDNGRLNATLLADKVFNNVEQLKVLNSIVHPFVFKYFDQWVSEQNSSYVVKESALLFNNNNYLQNDYNIIVNSSKEIRINRAIDRSKMTYSDVMIRINNQVNFEDYIKIADFNIYNDGQALIPQVINIHNKLKQKLI